jgi:hypothetical protein
MNTATAPLNLLADLLLTKLANSPQMWAFYQEFWSLPHLQEHLKP